MIGFPWLIAGGLAYLTWNKLILSEANIPETKQRLADWQTRLTGAMVGVTDTNLVVEWESVRSQLEASLKLLDEILVQYSVAGAAMAKDAADQTVASCRGLSARLKAAGRIVNEPNEPWGVEDYLKWGLIGVGGYFAYRLIVGDRSLSDLFSSSDEYPKAKLPRYAGGRRRLA